MKFLIIGSKTNIWISLYTNELNDLGIDSEFVNVKDIKFTTENGILTLGKYDLIISEASHIIFLAEKYERLYYYISVINKNAFILNAKSILKYPTFSDKFFQSILISKENGIMPTTFYSWNSNKTENELQEFPVVVKKLQSWSGEGVWVIKSKDELASFFENNDASLFELQKLIKTNPQQDFRSIILGGEIIGSVRRVINDIVSQRGSEWAEYSLDKDNSERLIRLANNFSIDFCAIDYAIIDNQVFIYEINRFPYISKFQKTTKINLAKMIIQYMLSLK